MGLYFKSAWMFIKCALEYRLSFILTVISSTIGAFTSFLTAAILINKFGSIDGWKLNEIMLILGIACFGEVFIDMFARGLDQFYKQIKHGLLDQILTRPRNITFQVLCSDFDATKIGKLVEYAIILIYGIVTVDVEWTIYKAFVLGLMIIGSIILFFSIVLLKATFSFWSIEGMEAMNILSCGGRDVASYPISIYKRWFSWIFTYLLPFGCVNYFPILYLLGKDAAPAWYGLTPLATVLFLLVTFKIWGYGLKQYKSTGS